MPNLMLIIIVLFVIVNVAVMFFYYKPTTSQDATANKSATKAVKNTANKTVNTTAMVNLCFNSTNAYLAKLDNITNYTIKQSTYFSSKSNATRYLALNWSNTFYDINGTEKELANKTTVSMVELITDRQRNFTIPVVCDQNGTIGNYSSCLLRNIPNIPSACYNMTINLSECEIEWSDHYLMDDIKYWVSPPGGSMVISSAGVNDTMIRFNFTINSSRRMLESFGMSIIQRTFSPKINDDEIFSLTNITSSGNGGTIYKDVNVTNMRNMELYATIWFKKKCYDKTVIY